MVCLAQVPYLAAVKLWPLAQYPSQEQTAESG